MVDDIQHHDIILKSFKVFIKAHCAWSYKWILGTVMIKVPYLISLALFIHWEFDLTVVSHEAWKVSI